MLPLIPLISGIVIGAVGVRLLKNNQSAESLCASTRAGLEKAESGLRRATISSLEAIKKTSESLQNKLERNADAEAEDESEKAVADDAAVSAPKAKGDKKS